MTNLQEKYYEKNTKDLCINNNIINIYNIY